jgi:hypothetical protein
MVAAYPVLGERLLRKYFPSVFEEETELGVDVIKKREEVLFTF